jgi:PPOX class probable F420-dependent enzyme
MTTLADVAALSRTEQGLAVISTSRADGTIHSSVVNIAVMPRPLAGDRAGDQSHDEVVAFVTYGPVKLRNLRARPRLSVTVRSGWRWATVEGDGEIIGPDDPDGRVDVERLRLLLREIFVAAGGTHDDWDTYDRVMAQERRAAVLVTPRRVYGR